jgi:hypothetical protein
MALIAKRKMYGACSGPPATGVLSGGITIVRDRSPPGDDRRKVALSIYSGTPLVGSQGGHFVARE